MKITLIDKEGNSCSCVGKHIPLPHKLFEVEYEEGVVFLCPNAMLNLLSLVEQHAKYDGNPPGSIRKHYSDFIYELHSLLYL